MCLLLLTKKGTNIQMTSSALVVASSKKKRPREVTIEEQIDVAARELITFKNLPLYDSETGEVCKHSIERVDGHLMSYLLKMDKLLRTLIQWAQRMFEDFFATDTYSTHLRKLTRFQELVGELLEALPVGSGMDVVEKKVRAAKVWGKGEKLSVRWRDEQYDGEEVGGKKESWEWRSIALNVHRAFADFQSQLRLWENMVGMVNGGTTNY